MRHPQIPLFVKDAICAHACEFVNDYLISSQSESNKIDCNSIKGDNYNKGNTSTKKNKQFLTEKASFNT